MWAMKLWDEGYKRLSQEMMAQRPPPEELVRGGSAGLAESGARGINLQDLSRTITNLVAPMPAAAQDSGEAGESGAEASSSATAEPTDIRQRPGTSRVATVSPPEKPGVDRGQQGHETPGTGEVLAGVLSHYASEPSSPKVSPEVKKTLSHGLLVVNTEHGESHEPPAATDTAVPPFHQTLHPNHVDRQQDEPATQPAQEGTPGASPRTPSPMPLPSHGFGTPQLVTDPSRPDISPELGGRSPPPEDPDPDPEAQHTPWEKSQPGQTLTPLPARQAMPHQQPAGWGAPLVPVNVNGQQLRPRLEASTSAAPDGGILAVGDLEVDLSEITFGHLIGEGGFGKVYLSTFRGRQVAVKVQSGLECSKASVQEEFKREVTTMHRLPEHRNVLSLLGACTVPPRLAIITEYCARSSLYTLLHTPGCHLSWAQIVYMLLGAALGMGHLHRSNVLHRDLKSANLLVDENYTVKVADFGLSRVQTNLATMTGGLGTYQWMAPEVLGNQRYSEKADVYSFGIVMWECTAREVPYVGMQGMQAAMAVMNRGLRPEIPPHTPPALADLIRACWRPVPSMRPVMAEAAAALKDIYQTMRSSSSSSQRAQ